MPQRKYNIFLAYKGVHFIPYRGKWCARISLLGSRQLLGYFLLYKDACDAVKQFRERNKSLTEPDKLKPTTTN